MEDDRTKRFVEMLTAHQRDLYAYINVLLAGDIAASDVVQETNLDLWANKEQFDFERPFRPWALRFAYHRVLAHRKNHKRSRLVFSDTLVEALSEGYQNDPTLADTRMTALQSCLEKLTESHRQLVDERYLGKLSVNSIAQRLGSTPNRVSAQLYRIRRMLARCIQSQMVAEGRPT